MKKIITILLMILGITSYSQVIQFTLMESLCKAEVWNNDSSRFEEHRLYQGCYGLYQGTQNDTMIIAIGNFRDSTDWTYYKVLSHQNMVHWELHWVYKVIQIGTGMICYIHHFRNQYYDSDFTNHTYNMVRVDLDRYTIRYIDEQGY
jgi:hypothetical protein